MTSGDGSVPRPETADGGWTLRLVMGLFLGVLVWAGLLFYGDVGDIMDATTSISTRVLLASLGLSTLNYLVRAVRWQRLLQTIEVRIPMGESTLVFLAGLSMTLTPMKVGEILKSALLKQSRSIPMAKTAPVVMAERITDLAAMVLLGSIGSLALDKGYYVAMSGMLFVGVIMSACTLRPVGEAFLRLCEKLPIIDQRTSALRNAYENLGVLVTPVPFLSGTLLGVIAWGTQCLALLVLVSSFEGVNFSFAESLFSYATPLLAGTLSMLPGGLGLTEVSMTGILSELGGEGMTPATAAASTILIRLVTFWWAIVVGLASLAVWRRRY